MACAFPLCVAHCRGRRPTVRFSFASVSSARKNSARIFAIEGLLTCPKT